MFDIEKGKQKFDSNMKPLKPRFYLQLIEWSGILYYNMLNGQKIKRINCKGLKPPYMILSNHASMADFTMSLKCTFPHKLQWIAAIDEFVDREWLFRRMGMIAKRKFTNEISVIKHGAYSLNKFKSILCYYPEARFSLCGINEKLSGAEGKFAKLCKVPVVTLIMHGNFLTQPQWNKSPNRHCPVDGEFTQIVTAEEVKTLSADEIQKRIEEKFQYDDYAWQYENKIAIKSEARANNIHRILYQCPKCKTECEMDSKNTKLWCNHCGAEWEMDEYGRLHCTNGDDVFNHVPDWYKWEREQVKEQVANGYKFEDDVSVFKLTCSHDGYKNIGVMRMTHDENGFAIVGEADGQPFELKRSASSMYSCHIEYGYHKRGVPYRDCIDLTDGEYTYFVSPENAKNRLTKIHFATEELYNKWEREQKVSE